MIGTEAHLEATVAMANQSQSHDSSYQTRDSISGSC